jgi:hypothetical protein
MKLSQQETYNLAIAWNWEFDTDFIAGIEYECRARNISTYRIDTDHLPQVIELLKQERLTFDAFYDRASDSSPDFLPLVKIMEERATCLINPYHRVAHAIDKATMHLEFITCGLNVPNTIILPPFNERPMITLSKEELLKLSVPFVIKPANTTGGGTGVILDAKDLDDVFTARQEHKNDKYLLQEIIVPKQIAGRRGWFRVYFAFGEIILCWWDDQTHRYTELTHDEETLNDLQCLRSTMSIIHNICDLDFFSSEIAITEWGKVVIVDYVNEVCDMRLQSKYFDGAPDTIVRHIQNLLTAHIQAYLSRTNEGKHA